MTLIQLNMILKTARSYMILARLMRSSYYLKRHNDCILVGIIETKKYIEKQQEQTNTIEFKLAA